jgi:hypothetical protein
VLPGPTSSYPLPAISARQAGNLYIVVPWQHVPFACGQLECEQHLRSFRCMPQPDDPRTAIKFAAITRKHQVPILTSSGPKRQRRSKPSCLLRPFYDHTSNDPTSTDTQTLFPAASVGGTSRMERSLLLFAVRGFSTFDSIPITLRVRRATRL